MELYEQRFETFDKWVNWASRRLTGHPLYPGTETSPFRAICFDSAGRQCRIGADFMRARDEGAFPVYWLWPDQIGDIALRYIEESEKEPA